MHGINQVQVQRGDRLHVRRRAALLSPPGSRRDHGRRDPRLRDRRDRREGGADRPPRALDPAHQRRALVHHASARHGRRAVPGLVLDRAGGGAAAGADHLRELQGSCLQLFVPRRWSRSVSTRRRSRISSSTSAEGATTAPRPASGGASLSTRCCRSATRSAISSWPALMPWTCAGNRSKWACGRCGTAVSTRCAAARRRSRKYCESPASTSGARWRGRRLRRARSNVADTAEARRRRRLARMTCAAARAGAS